MNDNIKELIDKLVDFQEAHINLVMAFENVDSDIAWSDLYPYEKSLDEYTLEIIDWVQDIKEKSGY